VPVIGDLAEHGVNRMVRLGTCLAIEDSLEAGGLILVERAVAGDGASRALSDNADFVRPDSRLLTAFDGLGREAVISSHDLVARYEPEGSTRSGPGPAVARDLQTAATLAMCRRLEIPAAALLIVAEDRAGRRLGEEELWEMFRGLGKAVSSRLERLNPNPKVKG
jgi:uridine phosphorylase